MRTRRLSRKKKRPPTTPQTSNTPTPRHTTHHPVLYLLSITTMTPASMWLLSIPAGFALCFSARVLSLVLQINSGVPLKNEFPRAQLHGKEVATKDIDGYVRRSFAAHQNSWEAIILWVSAVLMAKVMGVDEEDMNRSAYAFLLARAVYIPAYTFIRTHKASHFRTAVFTVSFPPLISFPYRVS